jgi:AbrB family looped-hinge helix DNA binding protein
MGKEVIDLLLEQAAELKRQAVKLQEMATQAEILASKAQEGDKKRVSHPSPFLNDRSSTTYQNIFRVKIRQKGQVTIPSKVRKELDFKEGDSIIGCYDTQSGEICIIKDVSIDPAKAWFWQDRWQEMLLQSMRDYIDGRTLRVDSLSDIVEN